VLFVLAQHLLRRNFSSGFSGIDVPPIGTFGVLIFFVHTCLVLMYSMERSGLTGAPLVKNFYIRRCLRIYPLSMVAVLTAVALHLDSDVHGVAGFSPAGMVSTGRILSNLFLVQNVIKPGSIINVLWSLPYEVQMYVLLPMLFLWIRTSPLRRACILWCASVLLALAGQPLLNAVGLPAVAGRLSLLRFVPNFVAGLIAYTLPHTPRVKSTLWLPTILALASIYVIFPVAPMGWAVCLMLGVAIPFFSEIRTPWLR
jgi:peptidoglycan/LPS O-acetylase OafA/YrhL